MICVKNIEVVELEGESLKIEYHEKKLIKEMSLDSCYSLSEVTKQIHRVTEMIQGETFRNARGETVCIGMSKKVQKALGLPFKVFFEMNELLDTHDELFTKAQKTITMLQIKIANFNNLGFFGRVKFLFKDV